MASPVTRTSRSPVWDHFVKPLPGDKQASCKICKKQFAYHGGTSNLMCHLKTAHPSALARPESKDASKLQSLDKFAVTRGPPTGKTCGVAKAETITELLVNWVTTNMRPLTIVEDTGFRDVLAFVEPGYRVPLRKHMATLVRNRHAEGRADLKKRLADAVSVTVTTDGWTSKAVRSYGTYTVHFLDANWDLQSFVLATRPIDGSHTAANIADHVQSIAVEFGIEEKIVAIVHDEAANMVAASRRLDGMESQVCAAHMLQTCLRHAFASSKPIQNLLAEARKVATHFHHSALATGNLVARQTAANQNPLKLVQDVPTRWNSSYYMLKRLLELKLHVIAVLADPALTPKAEHRALLLKEKRWSIAEDLMRILRPAEKATLC